MSANRSSARTLCVAALLGLVESGCGGHNAPGAPAGPTTDAEVASAALAATLVAQTALPGTVASVAVVAQADARALRPQGEFGLTCPVISVPHLAGGGVLQVTLSYGSGCTSQITGQVHSGTLTASLGVGSYTLGFTDFTGRGYTMVGAMTGTYAGPAITLNTDDFQLSGDARQYLVDAALGAAWSDGGSATNLEDDSWSLTGTATVTEVGARTHELAITEALRMTGGCVWPVQGVLTIQTGSSPVLTTIDFGTGECDDLVTATTAGQTKILHLGTGKEA